MFEPRYIKHSQLLVRHAEKLLRYRRDRLSEATMVGFRAQIEKVRAAMRARDQKATHEESERLDTLLTAHTPPHRDAVWRENVEVILVAIVVAIGIRSYFLQPFKIPTGSMQPTLNGIIGHPSDQPAPNIFTQAFDFVAFGRNYINVVSKQEDAVESISQQKFLFFFTFSRVRCVRQSFLVYAPPEILTQDFNVNPGNVYHAGDVIARGAVDTGDQVFVDKFSYNFIHPHRGDVFVFRTNHILGIREDPESGAPYYIKRLTGTPGDELRIQSPNLYVNGALAKNFGINRVMSAQEPYRGYSQGPVSVPLASGYSAPGYLHSPRTPYTIPAHRYFAMGDNSYNSYDSRYWGPVPEENVVGRGLFVYWPFGRHWGIIR
jgi:signal peptidase I